LPREEATVAEALRRRRSDTLADIIVDISKSAGRAPWCMNAAPCLVPNSKPYRVATCQLLTAEQVMALQGYLAADFPVLPALARTPGGRRLLRDLAGNGMTLPVVMAVLLVVCVHGVGPEP
jgi:hypothetical protein